MFQSIWKILNYFYFAFVNFLLKIASLFLVSATSTKSSFLFGF